MRLYVEDINHIPSGIVKTHEKHFGTDLTKGNNVFIYPTLKDTTEQFAEMIKLISISTVPIVVVDDRDLCLHITFPYRPKLSSFIEGRHICKTPAGIMMLETIKTLLVDNGFEELSYESIHRYVFGRI